jgi:hypothetical protein
MSPSKTQPALLGGVAIGVLSALPVVNLGNCACCAWVIVGGMLAAYLMQQNYPQPVSAGDGAIVGLMAGVVGAVVWTVISIPLSSAMAGLNSQMMEQALENAQDMPPELRSFLESIGSGGAAGVAGVIGFIFMLCVCSAFGLVGGILGALVFRKNAPPPPPPPPSGFTPGGFGSHGSHGEPHGGHTFRPPTFNPPPPPTSGT